MPLGSLFEFCLVKYVTAASVDHSQGKKVNREFLLLMEICPGGVSNIPTTEHISKFFVTDLVGKSPSNQNYLTGTVALDFFVSFLARMNWFRLEYIGTGTGYRYITTSSCFLNFLFCSFDNKYRYLAIFSLWSVSYQNSRRFKESPRWIYKFIKFAIGP